MTAEKFSSPKEIVAAMLDIHGVTVSRQFVCAMISAGVSPRLGFNVRLSDFITFWTEHPDFSPRARVTARNRKRARVTPGNIG